MTATMPSPIAALRASLSAAKLLGFAARTDAVVGTPQAKAAFVGVNQTIVVTSAADSGTGTLRAALAQNVTDGSYDLIEFAPGLTGQTITLQSTLTISAGVTIDGQSNNITISGGNAVGVFTLAAPSNSVEIDSLTIANGKSTGAAGTMGSSASPSTANGGAGGDAAGGIFVQSGTLGLSNDKFINDTATGGSGGSASTGYKGAGGGAGGNAAGAVYVEPGATVPSASGLSSYDDTATGGAGGRPSIGGSIGAPGTAYPVSNNSTVTSADTALSAPCYCTGTLIATARGDVAVEDLRVDDLVVTAAGEHRPIRWLGHRVTQCRNHPRSHEVMPVRIAAHAFAANRPARDLLVSPGHSICVDMLGEVLIPAMALINGTTIVQEDVERVTYWHVELDSHDVILAENLPCESYLEMGNRSFFAQGAVVALEASPDTPVVTHADFCRPFHADGALVDVVRARLRDRAATLGWRLDGSDPFAGLHLLADGVRIEPAHHGLAACFAMPAGTREAWLVCDTARPLDIAGLGDVRHLGVNIAAMSIDDGVAAPRRVDLADPLLCVGFHDLEDGTRRWTAGRARLPAALWADVPGAFELRVDLAGPALPRWVAPRQPCLVDQQDATAAA